MTNIEQSKLDAVKFLKENYIAVLATSHSDEPRASTVYYVMFDSFNFYFYTKHNSNKTKNILQNPRVALVVGFGPEHITVQVRGEAVKVEDGEEKEQIFEKLMEMERKNGVKMWPTDDTEKFRGQKNEIFKIVPTEVSFLNLDSLKYPDSISAEYVQIIP